MTLLFSCVAFFLIRAFFWPTVSPFFSHKAFRKIFLCNKMLKKGAACLSLSVSCGVTTMYTQQYLWKKKAKVLSDKVSELANLSPNEKEREALKKVAPGFTNLLASLSTQPTFGAWQAHEQHRRALCAMLCGTSAFYAATVSEIYESDNRINRFDARIMCGAQVYTRINPFVHGSEDNDDDRWSNSYYRFLLHTPVGCWQFCRGVSQLANSINTLSEILSAKK
jgi:hypothetical protein